MTYTEYITNGGQIDETIYNSLIQSATLTIQSLIEANINYWKVLDDIEDYGLTRLNKILTLQVDFMANNGGNKVMLGHDDFTVKQVSTSGITMATDSSNIKYINGVAIAPLAEHMLLTDLRRAGYMNIGIKL